jgi:hypothetical protein
MTPSYVSVHTIIAKVFSDLDLQETSHRLIDLINWAGEAVEKIGAVRQLHFKKTGEDGLDNIKVKDYHAKLPRDLFKLATVTYSPQKEEPDSNTRWFPMRTTTNTFKSGPSDNLTSDYTYFLKPGWININRRDGWLKLAYYVFPTDNDGYPLIPDTATYQEAVY